MKCPVCDDVKMREVIKDEVEIDVCPQCKGVWLDRGELEKLMQGVREVRQDYERMEQQMQMDASPFAAQSPQQPSQPSGGYPQGSPPYGGQGAPPSSGQGFGSQPYSSPQPGSQGTPGGQGFGGQPYSGPQHGGFGAPPPPLPGGAGYNQPPGGYGAGQPSNPGGYPPGYGQQHSYGKGHYGYDKYGRPYKKKKTVLDVFGDLFD